MTPDEVVALRVKELVESDRDLSTKVLAERLGIGEDQARDMQRPRRGRPQRKFTWEELVRVCVALDTNLFELVLPPPDSSVTGYRKAFGPFTGEVDRDGFARDIFGFPLGKLTPDFLSLLLDRIGQERGQRKAELESEIEKAVSAAREFMEAIETLERGVIETARTHEEALQAEEE